ncbi:MAG: hypothetical protein HXY40_14400 [Chloroflexi bacterium]|nr:hypothetical protein [Chloroflexota bacterium]
MNLSSGQDDIQWLTLSAASDELDIPSPRLRKLMRMHNIVPQHRDGRVYISGENVEKLRMYLEQSPQKVIVEDTGLIEISVALTGVATAITALAPVQLPVFVAFAVINLLSLYTSLWFLGEYVEDKGLTEVRFLGDNRFGLGHVLRLLTDLSLGPYWLLGFILSTLVIVFIFLSTSISLPGGLPRG